jgi:hypothetical protein
MVYAQVWPGVSSRGGNFPYVFVEQVEKSKKELDAKEPEIELHPDAWTRFERAVDTVIKSKPIHRQRPQDGRKELPRVHKGKSRA